MLYFGMSHGEHVLSAEVVIKQKAANCTQGRWFYEGFNISLNLYIIIWICHMENTFY